MEKIFRSMGDGILMLNAVFSKQQDLEPLPVGSGEKFKDGYSQPKHYFKGRESITKDFDPGILMRCLVYYNDMLQRILHLRPHIHH